MATKFALENYHKTLGQAVQHAMDYFASQGAVITSTAIQDRFAFDGVPYGATKEAHSEIETFKNKPTRKWAHLTIYRMESGKYEVTPYIL